MFNEQERKTIIMGLMYLIADHNDGDLIDLGFSTTKSDGQRVEVERPKAAAQFEEFCLDLIENFSEPAWDDEVVWRTRHKS